MALFVQQAIHVRIKNSRQLISLSSGIHGAFLFHENHGEKLFSPEIHDDDSIDFVRFEKIDMNTRFINFIIERRGGKREK